ncbi:MAG: cell division protein FtsA [Bacteroidales bacterium]|nr:cell division protein FtsA [Bacteroidales bacterium]
MEERYIATADLGTSKIAISVSRVLGNDIQVLYYKETPSDGIRYSTVFNPTRASEPLKRALKQAEDDLEIKITQLVIGLPRYSVKQESRPASVKRTDPQSCITEEEIISLKDMALDSYPLEDESREEIFGAVTQSFSADDIIQGLEDDIIGIPSDTLEGNFKIFVGSRRSAMNIDILMKNVGIKSVYRYFLPDVTAKAVLTSQEMDNGVALIEMGAGVTSVTIYQRSILRHFSSIPFGGKNITMDIKYECAFTENLAENIKLAYGACMPEKLVTMGEKIIQINDDESGSSQQLPVKYLSEIITARTREIINAILFEIQRSGYADKLRSGIVITGGGANLANFGNLVKDMSGYNVRMGFPRCKQLSFEGVETICESGAAATVGMILSAKDNRYINCTTPVNEYTVNQEGTVFEEIKAAFGKKKSKPEATQDVTEEIPDGQSTEKETAEEKKNRKKEKSRSRISWGGKISDGIGSFFEGTVGSLFDDMK